MILVDVFEWSLRLPSTLAFLVRIWLIQLTRGNVYSMIYAVTLYFCCYSMICHDQTILVFKGRRVASPITLF